MKIIIRSTVFFLLLISLILISIIANSYIIFFLLLPISYFIFPFIEEWAVNKIINK